MKAFLALILAFAAFGCVAADNSISLDGDWGFEMDSDHAGVSARWFDRALPDKIHLPGTMDDAGLGPKNTKPPTLEGPYRLYDYAGLAWYQRTIEIPAAWEGKRISLFLERCRWSTTVWLDDKSYGAQNSLIAPHVYDFGAAIAPGKHRLTICVDNTVKIDLGRFVSALFGGTWGNMNGIVGRIELDATPPVWIENAQVYPNVAKMQARVVVKIGNDTGQPGHGALFVGKQNVDATWDKFGGEAAVDLDMRGAKLWDEFGPNLSEVTVRLGEDTRTVRFGMRDLAERGTQFTMNGRPIFLRGTLESSVWPLTGYPPTDTEPWRRIFEIEKSYGLNFIRFHSWCPPEAAFAAADEEGIMIQVEGPQANVDAGDNPARDAFIEAEFKRMVDTYGNHPSFCLMTLGNEYGGNTNLLDRWVEMLIQRDPRHLYTSASSGKPTPNRQWTEDGTGRGVKGPGTERDLRDIVARDGRPNIGHEIGQWMYWPDFREIKKWTGVMALKNFELVQNDMEKKHLADQESDFVQASGGFATLLYKEEIEVLLRTPGYAGFSLLDMHDYPTQGTALIGPLDAFWDSKGFVTPEQFRRYCSPTVPLLRMPKRVYTSDETFAAGAQLANYGPANLDGMQPVWSIQDEHGRVVASGELPSVSAPTGQLTDLGKIQAPLAAAPAPCKLNVILGIPGTTFSNDWNIWVYPAKIANQPPPGVTVCSQWADARTALVAGKKVVLFPRYANARESLRGQFLPVFWSPVWFPTQKPNTMGLLCDPRHPLFAQFPTESYTGWQWYDLMEHAREFILDSTASDDRPLVQVMDNFARNHKLGIIFEGRVGDGKLLVSGFDLPRLANDPAARQLLASLYAYVSSANFDPKTQLDPAWLQDLFALPGGIALNEVSAGARADSAESGAFTADKAIDNDADTFWHTAWNSQPVPQFPHYLAVEFKSAQTLAGFTALPRQDGNGNGWIKDFEFYASNDGTNWGAPVAKGVFTDDDNLKTIKFTAPVTARFVKLVALSGYANGPWASLAEFNVIAAETLHQGNKANEER